MKVSESSGGKSRLLDEGIGRRVQRGEDGAKPRRHLRQDACVQGLEPGPEDACVCFGDPAALRNDWQLRTAIGPTRPFRGPRPWKSG